MLWRCWLGGRKGIRPVKTEWWGTGVVICLEGGADLHMAQVMPLPLTVSCFRLVLPFWYRLTRVVLDEGPLNGRVLPKFVFLPLPIQYTQQGQRNGTVSVHLSVSCIRSLQQSVVGLLVGRRYWSITVWQHPSSTACSSRCGQCQVYGWRRKLNTDLYSYLLLLVFHHPLTLSFQAFSFQTFSANPSHCSLSFSSSGLTTWDSPLFTVTSEHIRFYFLVFLFYTF